MPFVEIFTWVTGIATLVGLFLQLRDSYPEHRETRRAIVLVLLGFFLGLVTTVLLKINIVLSEPISGFYIFIGLLCLVLVIAALVGIFTKDKEHRGELFALCGFGLIFIMTIMFFHTVMTEAPNRLALSDEEFLDLASNNTARGNFQRAILFYNFLYDRIPAKDPRNDEILKKIDQAKRLQMTRNK